MLTDYDLIGLPISYDCLECSLGNRRFSPPGGLIYEDENVVAYTEVHTRMVGFYVVQPKRHVTYENELDDAEKASVQKVIEALSDSMTKLAISEDVFVQTKEAEGEHLKFWVVGNYIPRFEEPFDLSLFKDEKTMKKFGLKFASPHQVLTEVQKLKTKMAKKLRKKAKAL